MAKTLECLSDYVNTATGLRVVAGQVIHVDDALAKWLKADAPGCWVELMPPTSPSIVPAVAPSVISIEAAPLSAEAQPAEAAPTSKPVKRSKANAK